MVDVEVTGFFQARVLNLNPQVLTFMDLGFRFICESILIYSNTKSSSVKTVYYLYERWCPQKARCPQQVKLNTWTKDIRHALKWNLIDTESDSRELVKFPTVCSECVRYYRQNQQREFKEFLKGTQNPLRGQLGGLITSMRPLWRSKRLQLPISLDASPWTLKSLRTLLLLNEWKASSNGRA